MSGLRWAVLVTANDEADAERIADEVLDTVGFTGAPMDIAGGAAVAFPFTSPMAAGSAAEIIRDLAGLQGTALQVDAEAFGEAAVARIERVGGMGNIITRGVEAMLRRGLGG